MQGIRSRSWERAGVVKLGTAAAAVLVIFATGRPKAHKPITSRYTYNADVFPIFRARCGGCHVAGGASPMSLLSYKDAVPWADSIRDEITAGRMPPWYVDEESLPIRGGPSLTAKEVDTIITWASGGTPEGDALKRPPLLDANRRWRAGPPNLVVSMDQEMTIPAQTQEEIHELTLPTGLREHRFVKMADLLPGTPSIVRDATISVENGPVLAVWVPSEDTVPAPDGLAFGLPPEARLRLRIHYKKSWQDERVAKSDRSAIGLYFADIPAHGHEPRENGRELRELVVDGGRGLTEPVTVAAVRPALDQPYVIIDVRARTPGGEFIPLLRLRAARPEWPRRYWLARPVELPRGSRVEVTATPAASTDGLRRDVAAPLVPASPAIKLDVAYR